MEKTITVFQLRERITQRCYYAGELVVATMGDEGSIKEDAQNALKKLNIQWIDNVIGTVDTVLRRYARGDLQSGDIID